MADEKSVDQQIAEILNNQANLQKANEELASKNAELAKKLEELAGKGAAEAVQAEGPKIPEESFTVNKKKFKFTTAKFIVPEVGEVTALEALTSKKEYAELGNKSIKQFLVEKGSDVVKEVE
jgi:hypothetical protein